jgi:lipopolysaccharide/colanic/teichoic acid biosynthesis glycosyltransferase
VISLTIRYGEVPSRELLGSHIPSFLILWGCFLIVNFIAGLYDKRTGLIKNIVSNLLVRTQIINVIIGVVFFYFAPVGIAPKSNLFIYFAVSTALLFVWRIVMVPVFSISRRQEAVLLGDGVDIDDLYTEINARSHYGFVFSERVSLKSSPTETAQQLLAVMSRTKAPFVVADLHNPHIESAMSSLYALIFSGVQIVDAGRIYEHIFDRIPLSLVKEKWFVEQSSAAIGSRYVYDTIKRVFDVCASIVLGILSIPFYPLVYCAVKIEDGGPLFVEQERVGKDGKTIKMLKFRSMTSNDSGRYATTQGKSALQITKIGHIIRLTRIDELPQLWSVLKGDQSLIGPRPELPALTQVYTKEIPHYNARHLIKPGLSGWAQIYHKAHPHHAVAVEDTRDKLSYDLFYIKNRSLALDARIALQTLRALISKYGV